MNNEPINIPKVEKEKPIINKVETKKVEEVKLISKKKKLILN